MTLYPGITADEHVRRDHERTQIATAALGSVTRVVIEKDGVGTEFWADQWIVDVQDGGRTVKLFANGTGVQAAQLAAEFLGLPAPTVDIVGSSDSGINAALRQRYGSSIPTGTAPRPRPQTPSGFWDQ
ncbi:hypothetical protein [Mycobacteroides chelonae]|jgi:hypothetical protein|uniref:hypothetical protein n=1 Tax=Mycobacteroides chelonae TaxID=1774 RepID=UPI0009945606|nr:hypothetical protein [Mycobacteroides chelonae]